MTNVPIMSEFRVVWYTCMGVPDFPERIFDRGGDLFPGGGISYGHIFTVGDSGGQP